MPGLSRPSLGNKNYRTLLLKVGHKSFCFSISSEIWAIGNDVLLLINDYQIGTSVKFVFFSEVLALKSTDLDSN